MKLPRTAQDWSLLATSVIAHPPSKASLCSYITSLLARKRSVCARGYCSILSITGITHNALFNGYGSIVAHSTALCAYHSCRKFIDHYIIVGSHHDRSSKITANMKKQLHYF